MREVTKLFILCHKLWFDFYLFAPIQVQDSSSMICQNSFYLTRLVASDIWRSEKVLRRKWKEDFIFLGVDQYCFRFGLLMSLKVKIKKKRYWILCRYLNSTFEKIIKFFGVLVNDGWWNHCILRNRRWEYSE